MCSGERNLERTLRVGGFPDGVGLAAAAAHLDRWHGAVVQGFAERLLPIDSCVADSWGRLAVPGPISAVDALLAATAIVHGLTPVTRNVKDVGRTGVSLHNPFTE